MGLEKGGTHAQYISQGSLRLRMFFSFTDLGQPQVFASVTHGEEDGQDAAPEDRLRAVIRAGYFWLKESDHILSSDQIEIAREELERLGKSLGLEERAK